MAERELTAKQKAFVREYILCLNASEAARRAGYGDRNADKIGYQLLDNARVSAEIEKHQKKVQEKFELNQEYIIKGLKAVADANPLNAVEFNSNGELVLKKDVSAEDLRGLNFNVYPEYQTKEDKKRKIVRARLSLSAGERRAALELLGKHIGMWKDRDAGAGDDSGNRQAILSRVGELVRKRRKAG
jgi:phage terminase small subunit